MEVNKEVNRCLVFGDCHFPVQHIDTFKFLKALKDFYKPDLVVSTGDLIDSHSWSFHTHDPDLFSPSQELEKQKSDC